MIARKYDFVPGLLAGFCTTAVLILPFQARAQVSPAQSSFEVVRPGDRAMTCPALAAEINSLSQPQVQTAEAKPKKHGGIGFLRALSSAVPLAGGFGGTGGALVSSVAGTAQQLATTNHVDEQMNDARQMARDALAGGSPAQQRKERLLTIFDDKKC